MCLILCLNGLKLFDGHPVLEYYHKPIWADAYFFIDIVYLWLAFFSARYSNFVTTSSLENESRFFITYLNELFILSIAFVV